MVEADLTPTLESYGGASRAATIILNMATRLVPDPESACHELVEWSMGAAVAFV